MPQSKTKTIMKTLPINEVSEYRSDVHNFWALAETGEAISTVTLNDALRERYPNEKREWKTITPSLNEELKKANLISRPEGKPKSWMSHGFFALPSDFTFAPPANKAKEFKFSTVEYSNENIDESILDLSIRTLKKLGATVTVQF